jgi:hypothetical protein
MKLGRSELARTLQRVVGHYADGAVSAPTVTVH